MKLNEEELEKLPKADALCLMAYVKSQESVKEYEEKISKHKNPGHVTCKILNLVKETHESYSAVLLTILAELPTIKNSKGFDIPLIKKTKKKTKKK